MLSEYGWSWRWYRKFQHARLQASSNDSVKIGDKTWTSCSILPTVIHSGTFWIPSKNDDISFALMAWLPCLQGQFQHFREDFRHCLWAAQVPVGALITKRLNCPRLSYPCQEPGVSISLLQPKHMGHIWAAYGPHMGTWFATYGAFSTYGEDNP